MKKNIKFIDFYSKNGDHVSSNTSFIKSFINSLETQNEYKFFYYCDASSKNLTLGWLKNINLNNIIIKTTWKQNNEDFLYIYLYPEYKKLYTYFLRKIKGIKQYAVVHGHLNTPYTMNIDNIFKNFLRRLYKPLIFRVFEKLICYSDHIKEKSKNIVPYSIYKKLVPITELIENPISHKTIVLKSNIIKSCKIGFLRKPTDFKTNLVLKKLEKIKNLEIIKGWELNLDSLEEYFKFIRDCDFLISSKNWNYPLQVSGIINDCISQSTIPVSSFENFHYRYLTEQNLIKREWHIENITNYLVKNKQLNHKNSFTENSLIWKKQIIRKNKKIINNLILSSNKKIILAYQGRESGGGIIDILRFSYQCIYHSKSNLYVITRKNAFLKNGYFFKNYAEIINQIKNISFIRCLTIKDLNQIIFIMPNIRDLFLLICIKLFNRKVLKSVIIHNAQNHISSKNILISICAQVIEKLYILLADDIVFLSKKIKNKWAIKKKSRVINLPIIDRKKLIKENTIFNSKPKNNKKLLVIGRWLPYKNLNILSNAIESKLNFSQHDLIVAGSDYPKEEISRLRKACKNKSWKLQHINNFITLEESEELIINSDFVLFLYSNASQSGFMHLSKELQKNIICTDVGALKENLYNGGNGIVVKKSIKAISNVFNKIYVNDFSLLTRNKEKLNLLIKLN